MRNAGWGLGFLINVKTGLFDTTGASAGIFVLSLAVVVADGIVKRAENRLLRRRPREVADREQTGEIG